MKGFIIAASMVCGLQIANAAPLDLSNACELAGMIDETFIDRMHKCSSAKIIINSPGGYAEYKEEIQEYLKGKILYCIECSSLAAIVFSQHKGKRYIYERGILMFHKVYSECNGQEETAEILRFHADSLDKTNHIISEGFVGISSEEYLNLISHGDWYPTMKEIEKYQLADGVFGGEL